MKIAKQILGILVGVGLAVFLFSKIDFNEVLKYKDRIQPIYLIHIIILGFMNIYFNCLRDYFIYKKKVKVKNLIIISYLSNAAILFARRLDDVIKTYAISKESKESYLSAFFRINLGKLLNLFLAFVGGIVSFLFLESTFYIDKTIIYLCFLGIILFSFFFIFREFSYGVLIIILRKFFSYFQKEDFFQSKIKPYFDYAMNHFNIKYLFYPVIISIFLHFFLVYFIMYYNGKMLGIDFSYWEVLFISLLVNIVGLVPFVPLNGIGIYHAAIVSSFLVIGKAEFDGIVYGVVTHVFGFILTIFYGLIAYLFFGRKLLKKH